MLINIFGNFVLNSLFLGFNINLKRYRDEQF